MARTANTSKNVTQLFDAKNQPIAPGTSAPGWFIDPNDAPEGGMIFSEVSSGNDVEFYVSGQEYFDKVAAAIKGARQFIFIAGWQVNFDVELTADGKTLLQHLDDALAHADVYVMPWMSPKAGVDTGDFETMLAIHLLNAKGAAYRAHCLPAIAQSDMSGALNIAFAHHQKLVVVDNKYAFVGGIDLAYGRRDNGAFKLDAGGRIGNELYNACVAPIHEVTHVEKVKYLTRAELMAACFEGAIAEAAQFMTSAPVKPVAVLQDAIKSVKDKYKDLSKQASDAWNAADIVPDFVRRLQDIPLDALQEASRWAYGRLDANLQSRLTLLRETGSAHTTDAATIVVAYLNGVDLSGAPASFLQKGASLLESLTFTALNLLNGAAANRKEAYGNLRKLGKMVPKANIIEADKQPRLPWHDVQCRVEGPSAYAISANFVRRWNGLAKRYDTANANVANRVNGVIEQVYAALGVRSSDFKAVKMPRIPARFVPQQAAAKPGQSWVQVLRSAPNRMVRDEWDTPDRAVPTVAEKDCQLAMLKAIASAEDFIYIEGQFFQTSHGVEYPLPTAPPSGPMGTMSDIRFSPGYGKYARMLGIEGVPAKDIPSRLIWSKVDDVRRDVKGGGADFMSDVLAVLKGIATAETSRKLGAEQEHVMNPIGAALIARIQRAVLDKDDLFHVYMVLPVHPEGTLNTMNIMAQMHQTMQSLVFARESLLNGVRRAVLIGEYMFGPKKMSEGAAMQAAYALSTTVDNPQLARAVGDRWMKYLTLLNLRTWQTLGGRPVTEQCYVHSKLLIADDRVAVMGSANINDRSMLGDRDSELAVIVVDDAKVNEPMTGQDMKPVSKCVQDLRKRLWKKMFGLTDGAVRPASSLAAVLEKPAAPATWQAIQRVAAENAKAYAAAFAFVPRPVDAETPSSIWPTWNVDLGKLAYHMPFNERFWRDDEPRDETFTWSAKARARETTPKGVEGFIVALPITWTANENNRSRLNLTVIADRGNTPGVDSASTSMASVRIDAATPAHEHESTTG